MLNETKPIPVIGLQGPDHPGERRPPPAEGDRFLFQLLAALKTNEYKVTALLLKVGN